MAVPTLQFEAKVRAATRRTNKSGDWWSVTLEIQPHDFDEALCTMAQAQQRVMAVLAAIGDDEMPKPSTSSCKPLAQQEKTSKHRPPATTRAEKARRLCGVATFRQFVEKLTEPMPQKWADDISDYEKCSTRVKWWCSVPTKNDLDVNPKAMKQWDALLSEYEQQAGRMAERH